jgi:integrase
MSTGIEARHRRSCPARNENGGGRCTCTPTFQAKVGDAKTKRRISKTFNTRTAAKRWRPEAIAALRAGELSAERGPTVQAAYEAWIEGLRKGHVTTRSGDLYKPATIRDYERSMRLRILPVIGHLRLREVTTKDVQQLVDDLQKKKLASATIDAAVTPLKAMYRRAVARSEARINPTVGIEKPAVRTKARRVAPPQEAAAMIAALDGSERAAWATCFYAGLRRGEMIALGREEIDLAAGTIHVWRSWDMSEGYVATKNRKPRKVPIAAVLRDYLDEQLLVAQDGEHIFGKPSWVCRTTGRARQRWEDRGLPVLDLHEARHTYASFAIAAGLNAKTLSTYMGHSSIKITLDLYGHLFPGAEIEATGLLDAYFARSVGGSTVAPTVAHPEEVAA